jgi:hypothetical protein
MLYISTAEKDGKLQDVKMINNPIGGNKLYKKGSDKAIKPQKKTR